MDMTLHKAKIRQKEAVKNAFLEHVYSGCDTSLGITVDADEMAAAGFLAAHFLVEKTGAPVTIRDFSNDTHTLAPGELTELLTELTLFRQEAMQARWDADIAIDRADTESAVRAATYEPHNT